MTHADKLPAIRFRAMGTEIVAAGRDEGIQPYWRMPLYRFFKSNKLIDKGFRAEKKSFGSLLGISYYLSKDEFKILIHSAGGIMAEGSAICFDYPSENESKETRINKALARQAGETMKALYSYGEMETLLSECGFLIYEHLEREEMTRRFFSDYNSRNPGHPMEAPEGVAYLLAIRKP
jgi:O-methyltransferase involved in polyketide biosynthesis